MDDKTEAAEPAGICCPECGCPDVRVFKTRRRRRLIRRIRQCQNDNCRRRFITSERIAGDVEA